MIVKLKDPTFTANMSTALARGGDVFGAKNGYLKTGDVIRLESDGEWVAPIDGSGDTVVNSFKDAKGSLPSIGDLFVVSNSDKAVDESFNLIAFNPLSSGDMVTQSSLDRTDQMGLTLDFDKDGTDSESVTVTFNPDTAYEAGQFANVLFQIYKFDATGGLTRVADFQDSSVSVANGTTTVNGTYTEESGQSLDDDAQYIAWLSIMIFDSSTNILEAGFLSEVFIYNSSFTGSSTEEDWVVDLKWTFQGQSGTIATGLANAGGSGSAGGGTYSFNMSQSTGLATFPWATDPTEALAGLLMDSDGDASTTGNPYYNGAGLPIQIVATVSNQVVNGSSKQMNLSNPIECWTPLGEDHGYSDDLTIKIRHHGGDIVDTSTSKYSVEIHSTNSLEAGFDTPWTYSGYNDLSLTAGVGTDQTQTLVLSNFTHSVSGQTLATNHEYLVRIKLHCGSGGTAYDIVSDSIIFTILASFSGIELDDIGSKFVGDTFNITWDNVAV